MKKIKEAVSDSICYLATYADGIVWIIITVGLCVLFGAWRHDAGIETGRRLERELYETTPSYTWTGVIRKRNDPTMPPLVIEFNMRDMQGFYAPKGEKERYPRP